MTKNTLLFFIIVLILASGLSYVVYQDPEKAEQQLFIATLKQAQIHTKHLESEFFTSQTLTSEPAKFNVMHPISNGETGQISITLSTANNQITLRFDEGNTALAGQTIILEPVIKNNQVLWKCLHGSVLLRFRSKACRLGEAILLDQP